MTAASEKATKKSPARKKTSAKKRTTRTKTAEDAAPAKKAAATGKKIAAKKTSGAAAKTATKKAPATKKTTTAKKPAAKKAAATKPAAKKAKVAKKPAVKAAAAPAIPATPPRNRAGGRARATSKSNDNSLAVAPPPPKPGVRLVGGIVPYTVERGEEYMNERQLEHFRNILLAWKRTLMEEVDRTVHHMKDEAANFPDPNDRATQESEFSLELRTRDRERKLIKKIDEALDVVEADEYGYCESCGIEIGIRRLEARPTATLCIDCKTLDEIRERQMG